MKKIKMENPPIYNPLKTNGMNITAEVRNYKRNADENRKNGKQYRKQAKKHEKNEDFKERNSCLKHAALNFVDACEKYIKANALLDGEKVKHTHSFSELNKISSTKELLTEEDVKLLDGYLNKTNKSSHTELGYGDCQPTMDEVRRLKSITKKLYEIVDEKMEGAKFKRRSLASTEENSLVLYEEDDYYCSEMPEEKE